MYETERFDVAERAAVAKARLSEKLHALADRVDGLRESARPLQVVKKPWFPFAVGFAIGLIAGARRPRPRVVESRALTVARPTITGAILREILIAAAGTYTRKYIHQRFPAEP
jgi:hypothetical protein